MIYFIQRFIIFSS